MRERYMALCDASLAKSEQATGSSTLCPRRRRKKDGGVSSAAKKHARLICLCERSHPITPGTRPWEHPSLVHTRLSSPYVNDQGVHLPNPGYACRIGTFTEKEGFRVEEGKQRDREDRETFRELGQKFQGGGYVCRVLPRCPIYGFLV